MLVPWLAEKLASKIPVKTEEQMGNAVFSALNLSDSTDKRSTAYVNQFFGAMSIPSAYTIRISVVKGEVVNAFALPGGHIVVYTALLDKIKTYPELAALLSHEFTHVNEQHSTKSICRQLGSRIFLNLLFGSFNSVTSVFIDKANDFRSLNYSRSLEKEADLEGLKLLMQRKIDPRGFADLFNHLKEEGPSSTPPEFLASHPAINRRIAYIKEASNDATVENNQSLQAIFQRLQEPGSGQSGEY